MGGLSIASVLVLVGTGCGWIVPQLTRSFPAARAMSAAVVDDLRHEMDENVVAAVPTKRRTSAGGPKTSDVKASFLIRTLPRDCNPTPVPAGGMSASASGLLSPLVSKLSNRQEAEVEILQLDNPFDDITEEKLVGW
ncbi:unnamed protein product [Phytophthora fragariaefolia]|uniref:Unnamed protein product n=1 Tax=Phytophthora fragariaefolia TaxID=1490495 RepID=A0A9W6X3V9_9STRA|nr:unnamed protein product [Phytophthora fragariaefolia]